ncbi:MAG: NB-ARC domain-containing protein [Candidatus Competibacteraceae bacterium]
MPAPGAPREPGFVVDAGQQVQQQAHRERLRTLGRYPEITFAKVKDLAIQLLRSALLEILAPGSSRQPIVLPYPTLGTLFKGRDEVLDRLHRQLQQTAAGHATAIVGRAVHGLGGVGKTRLAVEYAWRHSRDYRALLFVSAGTPQGLDANLAALVGPKVLDLPEREVTEQAVQVAAVLRWLQQNPGWLLILDNVDNHEATEAVESLLAQLSGGRVLITSRLAQWSGSVQQEPLDVLDKDAAAAFLLERTEPQGTGPGRRRRDSDPADAIELARELDGLALALEQAGAYIVQRRFSLAEYLQAWRAHQPAVQTWYDARLMQYPRSVAVTWQTTIEQFGAGEIALLRLLAWLAPDPIPLFVLEGEPAEAIWREAVALVQQETLTVADGGGEWLEALITLG